MDTITEKTYPIRNIWLYKQLPGALILLALLTGAFGFPILMSGGVSLLVVFVPIALITAAVMGLYVLMLILQRANFHYALEDQFIVLHQGVISKENRNVPYGRIQGVFLNQGIFERIFGLASLTFEDFSQGGTSMMDANGYVPTARSRQEVIGFVGNKIHIPGMKREDAEALKAAILEKVKANPIEDSQSGL